MRTAALHRDAQRGKKNMCSKGGDESFSAWPKKTGSERGKAGFGDKEGGGGVMTVFP